MNLPEFELGYMAGIIDGEGSVGINKHRTGNPLSKVQVGSADKALIDWIHRRWPGTLSSTVHNNSNRTQYRWTLAGYKATAFLKSILPYLVLKQDRAQLVIAFNEVGMGIVGKHLTPEQRLVREELYQQCRKANNLSERYG